MSLDSILAKSPTIIFQPGGVTGGLVVSKWAEIKTFIALRQGAVMVLIDDSIAPAVADVGTTDCQGRVIFTSFAQLENPGPPKLSLPEGAILKDVREIQGFVTLEAQANVTPNFLFTNRRVLSLNQGGILSNVGTAPAIRLAGGAFLVVTMSGGSIYSNPGAGAGPLVDMPAAGAQVVLFTDTNSGYTTNNTVTGIAGTTAIFQFDASLGDLPTNPGFAGTTQKLPIDDAEFVSYEPAVPANWPVAPTEVAQALDELIAAIGAGAPNTMAYFDAAGKLTGTPTFITVDAGNGFVFFGATATDHGSSARIQNTSIVANGSQFRSNQYGNNNAAPGLSTFKSRAAVIGGLTGLLAGDPISRWTTVGVAPDNASIPLSSFVTIQVPLNFVPAGQNWLPSELEVQLVPLAGPINGRRVSFKITSEGEIQTLRGIRAGGPAVLPANLTTGTLWSSGAGSPNGAVVGSPGDLWSDTTGGSGATLWIKETGIATNTGWTPTVSAVGSSQVIDFAIGTGAVQNSVTSIPANAIVLRCQVTIATPYDLGTTIQVGSAAVLNLLQDTSNNNPQVVDGYDSPQRTPWGVIAGTVQVTIGGAPIAGAGFITVEYAIPNP